MYDYDKILTEALDRLFNEEFDKIGEKKDLKLGNTLLNIPKVYQEENKTHNSIKQDNFKILKEYLPIIIVIIVFLGLFLGAYPTISKDIFPKEKAQVIKKGEIEYICDVISQGELKTTGKGTCTVKGNNIEMKSTFDSVDDSINYMLIITNASTKPATIKKYKSVNKTNKMDVSYKMFYDNKEITSDNKIVKEEVTLEPKESLIVIVNQKYKEEIPLNSKELVYNINIDF